MIVSINTFEFPRVKNNENALPTAVQVKSDPTRDDLATDPFASFNMESMEYDHEVLKKARFPKSSSNLQSQPSPC